MCDVLCTGCRCVGSDCDVQALCGTAPGLKVANSPLLNAKVRPQSLILPQFLSTAFFFECASRIGVPEHGGICW